MYIIHNYISLLEHHQIPSTNHFYEIQQFQQKPKLFMVFFFFRLLQIQGLITEGRENIDPDALPFARNLKEMDRQGLREGASLVEVVRENIALYANMKYESEDME